MYKTMMPKLEKRWHDLARIYNINLVFINHIQPDERSLNNHHIYIKLPVC